MKKVYSCRYSSEAGMIISLLNSNDFHPIDLDMSSHVTFAGADIWYYVQVPKTEYETVKKFLIENGFKDVM